MKVTITHLKAPWPAGAAIGDIVEVGDTMPGCFVGKCKEADKGAKADHVYQQVPLVVTAPASLSVGAGTAVQTVDADALKIAEKMLAEARTEADELRKAAERLTGERDEAVAERDAALGERDILLAQVAELEKAGKKK
jgi:hypothetical protein